MVTSMTAHAFDDEVRALYQGPLDAFVGARQALAKRLKQAGDAREAEVRELRKPSVSAWAVNQLFAREPREMAALLGAGERARTVQRHAAAGGDSKSLRDLIAAVRAAVPRLAALGGQALAATGRTPGEAIAERLRNDLEALALDPAQAAIAARGWLDEDLPRPGFEVMAALQLAAAPPAPSVAERPAASRSGPARGRPEPGGRAHRRDDARAEPAPKDLERRERIERLRRELATAERAAAERAKAAEHTEQEAARIARDAAEAARRAADARARAEEARRAASDATRAVARAREALERSERG